MWAKANYFGDETQKTAVLAAKTPYAAKKCGRAVKGYDDAKWVSVREDIMREVVRAKFEQNPALMAKLRSIEGDIAEASPFDKVWGIGLSKTDPRASDPAQWKGRNLLGQILMDVRSAKRQRVTPPNGHPDFVS